MRVLHAISGLRAANGGPPMALRGLARAQALAGMEVTIVATWRLDPAAEIQRELEGQGIRVVQLGPASDPMSRHPDTGRLLEELLGQADVAHVHGVWEQIQHLACKVARGRGVPYVFTPHGMLDRWNMGNGWLKKRLYLALRMRRNLQGAAAMHFATQIERDSVARLGLRPRALVEPFGLWPAEFAELPAPGTFRARYPQIGERKIVMFLGRLDYGKGLELLIPAFASIARDDAVLAIVGPDSNSGYRATVEAMVDQHGLRDRCVLTGMLGGADKLAALVDAHVLCQPSFHENFGMVVIEALACGCPVVVSDQVCLHPEVTRAGVGKVCTTDVASVQQMLEAVLGDDGLREALARGAREFALSRYDWHAIGRAWQGHYEGVVKQRD